MPSEYKYTPKTDPEYIIKQEVLDILDTVDRAHIKLKGKPASGIATACIEIENIPPEDVAPIIRCKDCGLYYYAYNRVSEERDWTCAVSGEHRSKDDFCSRAIPKEEEDG